MALRSSWTSVLLSLLLVTGGGVPVFAQHPHQTPTYDFFNLTGGLNNSADPTSIKPTEASDLQNVVFDTSGGIEKRAGFARVNSSAACGSVAFTGLFMYRQADGDRFLVGLCANDTVVKMDYAGGASGPDGTWDAITGSLSFAIDQDDLADFATVQDVLVFTDGLGTSDPYTWMGSGNAAQLTAAPNAAMLEFHNRILWLAGRTDARSRVDFSNLDDYTTWTSTDNILVETDDNQVITGLKSAFDCLYVFKTESIHRICGRDRDNLRLEQMVSGVGAASNAAIQVVNNRFMFLTSQGDIALYDGGINIEFISYRIDGTLDPSVTSLNRYQFARSAFLDDSEFYLSLSTAGSGTHDLILMYDVDVGAWTKFSGINANALAIYEIGTQEHAILFGDYSGFANQYPSGTSDAGSSIEAFWQSGHLKLDTPHRKLYRELQLFIRQEGSYSITIEHRIDFAATGTSTSVSLAGEGALWDTAIWDAASYGDVTTALVRIILGNPGDFFQWRIEDTSTNNPFLLRGARLWVEENVGEIGGTVVP